MTRSERFRMERAWLKTHHFCTTKTLQRVLEEQGLSTEEREKYSYIQNKIVITAADRDWAGVPRKYWADKCGSRYRPYIQDLMGWNEIERNPSYLAADDGTGYPMSYRIPPSQRDGGFCNVDFHRKRIRRPRPKNDPTDDVSHYALKNLSALSVRRELILPEDPERRARIRGHLDHIAFGDFGLTYGRDAKRLYHRVVMMPSDGRCNLEYGYGRLVENDIRSCHPVLLLDFFFDTAERKRYATLLEGDIYTAIGTWAGISSRDDVKDNLVRVVNAGRKSPKWLKEQYVFNFFQEQYPHFTKSVLSQRTDLALTLQNFESELMVQRLGSFCRDHNLFWIPQHDGWITTAFDEDEIGGEAKRIIEEAVSFPPALTREDLWREY